MTKQNQINFRPSQQALQNLRSIQETSGANQTASIEMSIAFFAQTLKGENKMSKINFMVAQNLDYYGSEATGKDVTDYEKFAEAYLTSQGYDVEIVRVDNYPYGGEQYDLRQEVWAAFCAS